MPRYFYMGYKTIFVVSGVKDVLATLPTGATFNDNKWHQVHLFRNKDHVSITLDNVPVVVQRKYVTKIRPMK